VSLAVAEGIIFALPKNREWNRVSLQVVEDTLQLELPTQNRHDTVPRTPKTAFPFHRHRLGSRNDNHRSNHVASFMNCIDHGE
jgi:hypothetical protein